MQWYYFGQICIIFGANLASYLKKIMSKEQLLGLGAIWDELSEQHQYQSH